MFPWSAEKKQIPGLSKLWALGVTCATLHRSTACRGITPSHQPARSCEWIPGQKCGQGAFGVRPCVVRYQSSISSPVMLAKSHGAGRIFQACTRAILTPTFPLLNSLASRPLADLEEAGQQAASKPDLPRGLCLAPMNSLVPAN